ncbi:hypothetical protein A3K55_02710 [Candidatus Shapirobacteria bacterium RBG_13_44_7]|uniref:Uncharacterized protein n=1 Tax=Candidatus Shapirobacteria bacterium RBG_13_44_7 TaxID=1802149 RepID=A0A1F7SEQ5_9BACT|nr:MAG: hypothetical protein A3K55_02710 [Candidatus Shapirobacteria bacterium RBG_13_44_7]
MSPTLPEIVEGIVDARLPGVDYEYPKIILRGSIGRQVRKSVVETRAEGGVGRRGRRANYDSNRTGVIFENLGYRLEIGQARSLKTNGITKEMLETARRRVLEEL